ncbi:DNA-processing protein DprA [Flammeovirga sp. OC4]|uniref:DNA-processing protein DprA n=1 Tax=Flammeovirga sp. OC4 TaxID=1382345 RepID=UPI0005C6D440|nr:DNA-processing protein DprA [Flammeovirga sp. OC4]
MTETQKIYELWLNDINGIGGATCKQLISYLESAENVYNSSYKDLIKIPNIGEFITNSILNSKSKLEKAEKEFQLAEANDTRILTYMDKEFPKRLKLQKDAPYLIYVKGKALALNASKNVAIVGSRAATNYGHYVTKRIVEKLSELPGINIISGLAYGIDIHAHRAALEYKLGTIGVMANGLKSVYPKLHQKTANEMLADQKSGLISENSMLSLPDAPKFPARNRIIAALADTVIVVQAKKRGGALITADIANSYHKDVFAVPGLITDPLAEGCNNLIKYKKAHLFSSVDDILTEMNWSKNSKQNNQMSLFQKNNLTTLEQKITKIIFEHPLQIEEIAIQTQIPLPKLASLLLQLELKGVVKLKAGNIYTLN